MSEITPEVVKKIARLANLRLTAEEERQYAGQLENILGYIHTLNRLPTEGVSQTTHAFPLHNIWREDEIRPGLDNSQALAAAPEVQDRCFRVPRILE